MMNDEKKKEGEGVKGKVYRTRNPRGVRDWDSGRSEQHPSDDVETKRKEAQEYRKYLAAAN